MVFFPGIQWDEQFQEDSEDFLGILGKARLPLLAFYSPPVAKVPGISQKSSKTRSKPPQEKPKTSKRKVQISLFWHCLQIYKYIKYLGGIKSEFKAECSGFQPKALNWKWNLRVQRKENPKKIDPKPKIKPRKSKLNPQSQNLTPKPNLTLQNSTLTPKPKAKPRKPKLNPQNPSPNLKPQTQLQKLTQEFTAMTNLNPTKKLAKILGFFTISG